MNPVVRRIATHAALTGLLFAFVGFLMSQVAAFWLASAAPPTALPGVTVTTAESDAAFVATLRTRVPLFMALWGAGFVVVGETALHWWRRRHPAAPAAPPPRADETERLLEELLAQAEAARAATPDVDVQTPAPRAGELTLEATPPDHQGADR